MDLIKHFSLAASLLAAPSFLLAEEPFVYSVPGVDLCVDKGRCTLDVPGATFTFDISQPSSPGQTLGLMKTPKESRTLLFVELDDGLELCMAREPALLATFQAFTEGLAAMEDFFERAGAPVDADRLYGANWTIALHVNDRFTRACAYRKAILERKARRHSVRPEAVRSESGPHRGGGPKGDGA